MTAADAAFARALEHWRGESPSGGARRLPGGGHDNRHVAAGVLASEILLARVAAETGFEPLETSEVCYRMEDGEPVGSTLVCLRLAI